VYAFTSSSHWGDEHAEHQVFQNRNRTLKPTASNRVRVNTATDDKIGKGIDVALVTLVFLGAGYLLDRWLGTKPWFMVILVVLALIGEFVRFWYDYDARMKVLEAQRATSARAASPSPSKPSTPGSDRP